MHPSGSRHNSAELTQLLRKHSIGVARRLSTASQILWQQEHGFDPLLDPLGTPQSIQVGTTLHGEGVLEKLHSIVNADEDANDGSSHDPRPLFCELLVYRAPNSRANDSNAADGVATSSLDPDLDLEMVSYWQEASRWIKFEETVEEGGSRWSKPHVTLLNVQRLLQIRTCLQKQATLLDVNASSFGHVVELLSSTWTKRHHLTEDEARAVKDALMSPKRHLVKTRLRSEKSTPYDDSTIPEGPESRGTSPYNTVTSMNALATNNNSSKPLTHVASGAKMTINQSLFRKLPEAAEAACIFIGYVDELRFPISEFVRLLRASVFNDVTELPIPTRFIFTLLLPTDHVEKEAAQLGRCMGTLFVDEAELRKRKATPSTQVFSRVCYKARHGYELAYAIDELLSESVVVPPGKWNPSMRLEPPENAVTAVRPVTLRTTEARLITASPFDDHEGPAMKRSGRLFGGLVDDVKCKMPWYLSDFTDVTKGRISQTVAAAIFLFFANISKIITFGGVMGHALDDYIGAIENVMAGGICGVIYALFSGQPLCVLSATGPCLVFEVILYKLSYAMKWNFLIIRAWVGMWTAVVLMILVAVDASVMVSFITRFTEEAFATMISIIFLIKAVEELLGISHRFPMVADPLPLMNETCQCLAGESYYSNQSSLASSAKHHGSKASSLHELVANATTNGTMPIEECLPYVPDVFMFSVILFFFTFIIAFGLKMLRHSPFFPTKVREIIADFNVTIAIFVMSAVNTLVGLRVPCLEVPDRFQPTRPDRGWIVNPFALEKWWLAIATVLPAIFFSILVMMDQNITSVIINRKDNKLKKGYGYHLDLAVIAVLMIVCSVLGIPFYVAATVISLMHVHSLRLTSETVAPGEKPQFLGLREQRVTALLAHILIGLAVFLTPVMKHIPMPVLLGVFLYMGIVSLAGQQFVMRLLILLMPAKHQPDYPWLRLVRLKRVNLFTIIQLISLVFLMIVEEIKTISMVFPLMLVIMIFIRKWLLERVFTQKELFALDDPLPSWREVLKPQREHVAAMYTDGKTDQLNLRQDPKIVVSVSPT